MLAATTSSSSLLGRAPDLDQSGPNPYSVSLVVRTFTSSIYLHHTAMLLTNMFYMYLSCNMNNLHQGKMLSAECP
jgi:hypothetical protein